MMIKHLINNRKQVVYSNVPLECMECIENCVSQSQIVSNCAQKMKKRQGVMANNFGLTYLCSDDNDDINSARIFKEKLKVMSQLLGEIIEIKSEIRNEVNDETKRLIHNLTSLNGHNIQEIYYLMSQEELAKDMNSQLQNVRSYIRQNIDDVALALLRIAKNNMSMKTEFSVFNKLYETSPRLDVKYHAIHKVLLNVLSLFFQDFTDLRIKIEIDPCIYKINFDYESMHVALYHLIQNAAKYSYPESEMYISFKVDDKYFSILFDMVSLKIEADEISKIFKEGYSGVNAVIAKKSGNGIGMSRIVKLLMLNRAEIIIRNNISEKFVYKLDGVYYENNIFEIRFDKNLCKA